MAGLITIASIICLKSYKGVSIWIWS